MEQNLYDMSLFKCENTVQKKRSCEIRIPADLKINTNLRNCEEDGLSYVLTVIHPFWRTGIEYNGMVCVDDKSLTDHFCDSFGNLLQGSVRDTGHSTLQEMDLGNSGWFDGITGKRKGAAILKITHENFCPVGIESGDAFCQGYFG